MVAAGITAADDDVPWVIIDSTSTNESLLTGMAIGGVTPFGLPADLPLWVDGRVMTRDRIILGGGSRDRKVLAPPAILTALGAEIVEGLAREPS